MKPTPAFLARALALVAALGAATVAAETPRFELTPFVGGRIGGGFDIEDETTGEESSVDLDNGGGFGIDLGLYAYPTGMYELLYSSQSTGLDANDPALDSVDIRVDYLQVGGTALFPQETWFVPYLSLTIGATFLEPEKGNYDSETKFSGSIGGGFRFPVNERFNVVLGLRGYLTLIDSDTDLFCVSEGGDATCLIKSTGSTFFQTEGQLGVSVRF
ncbi:MAG TPA: outer membrane beta-barrel protein [Steroidobacteraceae bacterium]|nr:outer membrane beta-barrel protein [Steroidobacteraceae bacterium]